MTIETLKKAENIQEKIKGIYSILKRLDSVPVRSLQKKGVVAEEDLTTKLTLWFDDEKHFKFDKAAVEMVQCLGMAVGKDVFDTCVWIGRFFQVLDCQGENVDFVYRNEEKICLCGSMKAKDTNIKQSLINRYAKHDYKTGKGVKKNPDTFYGVSKDVWQAIAVGVTYYEKLKEGVLNV